MLRVTVEVWPGGNAAAASVVAEGFIANDGTCSDDDLGNYDCAFHSQGATLSGRVVGFPRRLDALQLLRAALNAALEAQRRESG